jgi:dTDP-4-dehydrorhamnose 3,5-epimerase
MDSFDHPLEFSNLRHHDHRGFFQERFSDLDSYGISHQTIVQENISFSRKGVLRGWHWQLPPVAQAKLVTCVNGAILDACIDIRRESPTFGEIFTFELDSSKLNSVWIPVGFAHAFQSLADQVLVLYSTTALFNPGLSRSINPLDDSLPINWPIADPILSEKDASAPLFIELHDVDLF